MATEFRVQKLPQSKLYGVDEFARFLKQFPEKIAQDMLFKALGAGLAVGRNSVRKAAPTLAAETRTSNQYQRFKERYGTIKDNIRYHRQRVDRYKIEGTLHTGQAFWGYFIENGFSTKGGGFVPGRPWFEPAANKAFPKMYDRIVLWFTKNLEKEAAKLGQRYGTLSKTFRKKL